MPNVPDEGWIQLRSNRQILMLGVAAPERLCESSIGLALKGFMFLTQQRRQGKMQGGNTHNPKVEIQ